MDNKEYRQIAHDNLHELFSMIERRKDTDPYIASMKQYIVNPLAYLAVERISQAVDDSTAHNNRRAEIALSIQKLEKVRDCYFNKKCLPCKNDIDAVLALLRPMR